MPNGKKHSPNPSDPLHDKLCEFIERQGCAVDRCEMTPGASIADDLGFDSLDCIELVMDLEEYYDIEIPEQVADNWKTFGDVEEWLKKQPAVQRKHA